MAQLLSTIPSLDILIPTHTTLSSCTWEQCISPDVCSLLSTLLGVTVFIFALYIFLCNSREWNVPKDNTS